MFTRDDTKAVKGVAVLLMLLHHLAAFPERYPVDFAGFTSLIPGFVENGYLNDLAMDALVCVPLFFFLGGYGLYKRMQAGTFRLLEEGLFRLCPHRLSVLCPAGGAAAALLLPVPDLLPQAVFHRPGGQLRRL